MVSHETFAGLWLVVVVMGAGAGALPAQADAMADYRVPVRDLDLGSTDGVAELYTRLGVAARSVCGLEDARGYVPRRRARRCVADTLGHLVAELDSGLLRAQHRTGLRDLLPAEAHDPVVRRPTGRLTARRESCGSRGQCSQ